MWTTRIRTSVLSSIQTIISFWWCTAMILSGAAFVCTTGWHAIARARITTSPLTLGKWILDANGTVARSGLRWWWHTMAHHRRAVGPYAATIRSLHHHWVAGRTWSTAMLVTRRVRKLTAISVLCSGSYTQHNRTKLQHSLHLIR